MPIVYLKGDATEPKGDGIKIIAHVCNDVGMWEAGFVLALRKWPMTKTAYRNPFIVGRGLQLGEIQIVPVQNNVVVANMVAQNGVAWDPKNPTIRYKELGLCLDKVIKYATDMCGTIHMPRIGCGIAAGKWEEVEKVINDSLKKYNNDVNVYVYDLK